MADDPETKDEIDDAKEDLRDALHQINDRVEERVCKLRPDRGIRKRPLTTACVAGALGFALGSDSGEAAMIGLLLLGAALMLTHETKVDDSGEIEPV
ncbi:MAG TPA: hypothetical protein VJX23_11995 [Candidatus Binataceae bacterium]|nr:hypothetical protein [Candidatus Binataceae bacterium]